jgi:tetratricopeptide (TPR) repeat protein
MLFQKRSTYKLIVYGLIIFCASKLVAGDGHKPVLELQFIKNNEWALTAQFLSQLASISQANIFIESGTYTGTTVEAAKKYFHEVHSIELSHTLYLKALDKFKQDKNVSLYQGDSAKILPRILPDIKGKIIFWLDAHYSGGITAKGGMDTPIMYELEAIKKSGLRSTIILIDDIRCFGTMANYPVLCDVYKMIKSINPLYNVEIMGDVLIAYLDDELFQVSPVIKACTVSRFADCLYSYEEILNAEKIIAQAQGVEKEALSHLNSSFIQNCYSNLWYGLICLHEKRYEQASENLKRAQGAGITHWRLFWYLGLNAFEAKWYEQARQYIDTVRHEAPFFEEAIRLSQRAPFLKH